jgi:hypothetical protein
MDALFLRIRQIDVQMGKDLIHGKQESSAQQKANRGR